MTIENEPTNAIKQLDTLRHGSMADAIRILDDLIKQAEAAGHARGVAYERARSAIELAEVKAQADYVITNLSEQIAELKAEREAWRVSGKSAELSILRNERARREGERGPRPSYEELSRIAHRGLTGDESIVDGLRRERMNLFNAGVAWAESGRAEQPPRGPRPPNPWHRNDPEHRGWNECAAAYEAWMVSGREGPSEADVERIKAILDRAQELRVELCARESCTPDHAIPGGAASAERIVYELRAVLAELAKPPNADAKET